MPTKTKKKQTTLSSVAKALQVLDAFIDDDILGVSEVARSLNLPKSTTYRLIATLEALGFLAPGPGSKYTPGPSMYRLSRSLGLRKLAHQALTELHFATRDTVLLSVLRHHTVMHIDRIDSERALHDPPRWRVPAHAVASGKILLAHSEAAVVDEFIAGGLGRLTPRTIVDPTALRAELTDVRQRGYAIDRDEDCIGFASVAVPVRNSKRNIAAAISIKCSSGAFDRETVQRFVPLLIRAADHVSDRLSAG